MRTVSRLQTDLQGPLGCEHFSAGSVGESKEAHVLRYKDGANSTTFAGGLRITGNWIHKASMTRTMLQLLEASK